MHGRGFARRASDESGSAPAEFVMVSAVIIALVLGVVQLALSLHVRNSLQDAAAEGARWASLADNSVAAGIVRTKELIALAVGSQYAVDVTAINTLWQGRPVIAVTVRSALPLIGLFGPVGALSVTGHAAREQS